MAVIFVTGGSRGIGLALVAILLEQGHGVASYSRSATPELTALKERYGQSLLVTLGDLADTDASTAAVARTLATFGGRLDSVVLNGATGEPMKRMADVTPPELAAAFAANVFSIIAIYRAALPALRAAGGRLVVISSGLGVKAEEGVGTYAATKAAVNRLVEVLGMEEKGITTVAVNPGFVNTQMARDVLESSVRTMSSEMQVKIKDAHAGGHAQAPEVPAAAIAALALRAGKELSGRYLDTFGEEAKALL